MAQASKISQALTNLFEKQRIVFWYDDQREFRSAFAGLELPGVPEFDTKSRFFAFLRHRPQQNQALTTDLLIFL